jgi:hypothetical protein
MLLGSRLSEGKIRAWLDASWDRVDDKCALLESTGWAHLLDGRDIRNDHCTDVKVDER